ncbi:MAG: aminopeptidase [Candidatus Hodarchaeaceae archaeon]|nr:aminopeptidase [Candidatus Hodarchaeaceae archaeon]
MSELSTKEIEEIARAFVRSSMRIGRKRGGGHDAVRILYNRTDSSCEKFALKVEEECWRVGAHTLLLGYSSKRQKLKYLLTPERSLREMSPFAEAVARRADALIFIGEEDEPNWARGLARRVKLTAPIRERLHEITDRRRTRWAYFGWPIPGTARAYGCPVEKFRGIFFDSIRKTFTRELPKLCKFYHDALAGKNRVQIVADDGTDLSFRIKGRPVLVDDGMISREDLARGDVGVNIPAGEVFVAPLETSADGEILFERVAIPGFGKLEGLKLRFRRGKVVSYEAAHGRENFTKFLAANTGEKDRIGEFGIGTNPGAEYTGGSIIIDEKILGTAHIAIGNNRGAYHGKNRASSHLDMIKDMESGQVFVDGKLIMNKGKIVEVR